MKKLCMFLSIMSLFGMMSCSDNDEPVYVDTNSPSDVTENMFNSRVKNNLWIEDVNTPYEIYDGNGELLKDAELKYFTYGTVERRIAFQITDNQFVSYAYSDISQSNESVNALVFSFDSFAQDNGDVYVKNVNGDSVRTLQIVSLDEDKMVLCQDFGNSFVYD